MTRSTRDGFTLIELMVVVAIIAVLAAILFPVFSGVREKARQVKCRSQLMQLVVELNSYRKNNGHYPEPPRYDGAEGRYVGGLSELYPDYLDEQTGLDLLVCPDDKEARQFVQWCRDVVYSSYNGIIDWTDTDANGAPDDPTLLKSLYNYYGYTYCCEIDEDGQEVCDCSSLPGFSSGFDVGDPDLALKPALVGGSWMDQVDADGNPGSNGVPDWLDRQGLHWRHFPRLQTYTACEGTIVTHCICHRRYSGLDVIVRLSGKTETGNPITLNDPAESGISGWPNTVPVAGWVHQSF